MDCGKIREFTFSVPGPIKTKNTGKIIKVGGFNKIVQPRESVEYCNLIKLLYKTHIKSLVMTEKPVKLDFNAYIYPTKAIINSKRKSELIKNDDYPYCKKPDIDRVFNQIADALKGLAFRDDTQLFLGSFGKFYSLKPRVDIKITIYDDLEVI